MPTPTDEAAVAPEIAPQVCEVAPDAAVPLPDKVTIVQGKIAYVPPSPSHAEVFNTAALAESIAKEWVRSLVDPGYGHALPDALDRVLSLSAMRAAVDPNIGVVAAPYNARWVPAGGKAVLATAQGSPESDPMGVDQPRLSGLLTRERYLGRITKSASWFVENTGSQHHQILGVIDQTVRTAVGKVSSLVTYNSRLRRMLDDALEMIKGPAEIGKKTRADNDRLIKATEERVRADEQKKAAAEKAAAVETKPEKK